MAATAVLVRRPAALAAALLATGLFVPAARPAAAQTITTGYAPVCAGRTCSTVRFGIANGTAEALVFNTLTLVGASNVFAFAAVGGVTTFQGADSFGPLAGTATVTGGTSLFVEFLTGAGFPFELASGDAGFVEVDLAGAPALRDGAFRFAATFAGGGSASGTVAVVPEPSAVVLLGVGLAGAAGRVRRHRRR